MVNCDQLTLLPFEGLSLVHSLTLIPRFPAPTCVETVHVTGSDKQHVDELVCGLSERTTVNEKCLKSKTAHVKWKQMFDATMTYSHTAKPVYTTKHT